MRGSNLSILVGFEDELTRSVRMYMGTLKEQVAALKVTVSGENLSTVAQNVMFYLSQVLVREMGRDGTCGMPWMQQLAKSPPAALQDLLLMLYVHMAWLAQQQHQERRSKQRGRQQQQQQQQVPAWQEQFLAAVGASGTPAGGEQEPGSAAVFLRGTTIAVQFLFMALGAHDKYVSVQDNSIEPLLSSSGDSSSSSATIRSTIAAAASTAAASSSAELKDGTSTNGGSSSSTTISTSSSSDSGSDSGSSSFDSTLIIRHHQQQRHGSQIDLIKQLESSLPYPEVLLLLIELVMLDAEVCKLQSAAMMCLACRLPNLLRSATSSSAGAAAAIVQPVLHHLGPMLLQVAAGDSSSSSSSSGSASTDTGGLDASFRMKWYASLVQQLIGKGAKLDAYP
jgi:hypothetical protein